MTTQGLTQQRMTREGLTVAVALVLLVCLQLYLVDGFGLFYRPLWLDEMHTYLLVTDPNLGYAMRALAQGADFNPPGLFILLRGLALLQGGITPVSMPLFALGSVLLALVGLYMLLRLTFRPLPRACYAL